MSCVAPNDLIVLVDDDWSSEPEFRNGRLKTNKLASIVLSGISRIGNELSAIKIFYFEFGRVAAYSIAVCSEMWAGVLIE